MKRKHTLFDSEHQLRRTRACQDFLRQFLSDIADEQASTTVLDVACGVGWLAETLSEAGLDVTAIDARAENVDEAKRRLPHVRFHVHDVETDDWGQLGRFQIVVCFGLLYHLENPLHVVRRLFDVTESVLLLEAQIAPGDAPSAVLMNEPMGEDKALNGVAFVPTENCLVKMCYQAGFGQVYKLTKAPRNRYFRSTWRRRRQRTILVAAKNPFSQPGEINLTLVAEPHTTRPDLWSRVPKGLTDITRSIRRVG